MAAVIIYTPPPAVQAAVNQALSELPNAMDSDNARAQLYGTGLQESRFKHRRQLVKRGTQLVPDGPAKSYWQGERTGGMCAGILRHRATRDLTRALCLRHAVEPNALAIWNAIEHNDILAASCARLLLWTDPQPLPDYRSLTAESAAWDYYMRTWRPGKPHPETWADCWAAAVKVLP